MDKITVHLTPAARRKFTRKYIVMNISLISLGIISVIWFVLRISAGLFSLLDIFLIAMPFVSILSTYGFMQMIRSMNRLDLDKPILELTDKYIQIESKHIPVDSITKIVQQKDVTFIYADGVERFVRILPHMRGDYGHQIDERLQTLWEHRS